MSGAASRPGRLALPGRGRLVLLGALLGFALMLPLYLLFAATEERVQSSVITLGAMELGFLWGVLAAWRLPAAAGAGPRALPREVANGLVLAGSPWAGSALAGVLALPWTPLAEASGEPWAPGLAPIAIGGFAALFTLAGFGLTRAVARAWSSWNDLRRTKLRWALTHAVLTVSLVLAVVAAVMLTAADVGGNVASANPFGTLVVRLGPVQTALALLIVRVVPAAMALFLVSLLAGLLIVPPVAAISFPVVGQATRRLEDLARAAGALRAGDLDARSPVAGADEIAHLQADFNAMAADLQRAQEAVRGERDAVAALLENRRELIAAVSHELRTPLATLRGYLDSALDERRDSLPPTVQHDLEIMRRESERLDRLIDDLFALSRAEIGRLPLDLQPTAVGPLLQQVAESAAALAWVRGRVEVLAQPTGDLPLALVDPARLEQALRNLVTNAVRHTPPGGVVLLTGREENGRLVLRVQDTGSGIAAADLPHVWDRFFRAEQGRYWTKQSADREGAGLGLALVKELTEAMGGAVAVESVPGEGSCFSLTLPVSATSAGATPARR